MRKSTLFVILFSMMASMGYAQLNRYLVRFKDKANSPFSFDNPSAFLSPKAVERRIFFSIPIDSTDLPINPAYIDNVRMSGTVSILSQSKWLNQIAIRSTDATALAAIQNFQFVEAVEAIANKPLDAGVHKNLDVDIFPIPEAKFSDIQSGVYDYGTGAAQVRIHQGDFLHNWGFDGRGMHVAVLDAGFYHYETLPAFDSIRINNQILGTWDFVRNEASVNEDHYHGMMCLSSMAANLPGQLVGTAPGASYYLFRTEEAAVEYPLEEHNWVAGLEKSDSLGVEVSSTSLGYTTFSQSQFNHSYADMDGKTTMAAIGANLAFKKGMLLIAAAGNEGNTSWHFISTPADADSVLAVGAVDTLGNVAAFSGYGPSSDGDIKPNVAAVGWNATVSNTVPGPPIYVNGTSFACPNLAGMATSLYQAFPECRNSEIFNALQMNASHVATPNNRIGYGIPDMKKAFVWLLQKTVQATAQFTACAGNFDIQVKAGKGMQLFLERKGMQGNVFTAIDSITQNGDFQLQSFQFTDSEIKNFSGNLSYRIVMKIGGDTSFVIDSATHNKTLLCPAQHNQVSISPNPTKDILQIQFTRTTEATLQMEVYNALGQRISSSQYGAPAGESTHQISVRNLSSGMYFLKIHIPGEAVQSKPFMKL